MVQTVPTHMTMLTRTPSSASTLPKGTAHMATGAAPHCASYCTMPCMLQRYGLCTSARGHPGFVSKGAATASSVDASFHILKRTGVLFKSCVGVQVHV